MIDNLLDTVTFFNIFRLDINVKLLLWIHVR